MGWHICLNLVLAAYISALFYFLMIDFIMQQLELPTIINFFKPENDVQIQELNDISIYLFGQNMLMIWCFKLSMQRNNIIWRNINKLLQLLLAVSCMTGLMIYIVPVY